MSKSSYHNLIYHIIFGTKKRIPFLDKEKIEKIRELLKKKEEELGIKIHILNGVEDHIHILCSIPPKISISKVVMHIKGFTSYSIDELYWQKGFAAFTLDENSFMRIYKYIEFQEKHHKGNKINKNYENF